MHEHMDHFKLINMNGRVYEPVTGQFLSPDPFVTDPSSTMGFNRYAYCNFNPLKYVDPSGYTRLPAPHIYENPGGQAVPYYMAPGLINSGPLGNSGLNTLSYYQNYLNAKRDDSYRGSWNSYLHMSLEFEQIINTKTQSGVSIEHTFQFVKDFYTITRKNSAGEWVTVGVRIWGTYTMKSISPSGDGGNGNSPAGLPEWTSTANTGVGAFSTANGAKEKLIEFAAKSAPLGKTGTQYLKYVKGLGYVGAGLSTTYSFANAGTYYYNGGTDWQVGAKATLDVIMTGVGFLGPIGFGISAIYFVVDAAGGFGDFGEIKP
jgi:RHS repeat-associated protein